MPLRLDANGSLSVDGANALLAALRRPAARVPGAAVPGRGADLADKLQEVHARSGVPLVADESVCRLSDARRWARLGGYQYFNIRVGKSGGLLASRQIMGVARGNGIGLVGGSMVGRVRRAAPRVGAAAASHDDLPYVEGLAQNRALLACEPVNVVYNEASTNGNGHGPTAVFRVNEEARQSFLVGCRRVPNWRDAHDDAGTGVRVHPYQAESECGAAIRSRADLMGDGILESLAMMDLIVWLEQTFKITIDTQDLVPENFGTLDAMANYVAKAGAVA